MSRYYGLDKINVKGLELADTYRRVKIYNCTIDNHEFVGSGYCVVSRGYCVDSQLTSLEAARAVVDHFLYD
jgi:hypothetical protein